MNVAIIITFGIVILLLILCITMLILHIFKFRKYVEKYNSIWSKFENSNIEKDIENLINYMEETRTISEDAKKISEDVDISMIKCVQKIGFVKYSAYEKSNNELSFVLAILDKKEDGVIINSIYTRNGSNIYAKQIVKGEYNGTLSYEEKKALQDAKNSKTYM